MLKLVSLILYFIRELVFDSKKEYQFTSPDFDSRKMTFFALLTLSATLNFFLAERCYNLAENMIIAKQEITRLQAENLKIMSLIYPTDNMEKNQIGTPSDRRKDENVPVFPKSWFGLE